MQTNIRSWISEKIDGRKNNIYKDNLQILHEIITLLWLTSVLEYSSEGDKTGDKPLSEVVKRIKIRKTRWSLF
jgi:hypothetical protein